MSCPTDTANYTGSSGTVDIDVTKATPNIAWNDPADIASGTPLGATQLNATPSVPGTLVYTPPAGTVLSVGSDQVLSVTLTPADAANYTGASATAHIDVVVGNSSPSSQANGPYVGAEGTPIVLAGVATDPDGDTLLTMWAVAAHEHRDVVAEAARVVPVDPVEIIRIGAAGPLHPPEVGSRRHMQRRQCNHAEHRSDMQR